MSATPPVAGKIPRTDVVHGDVRQDDYFWMRGKDDPEVTAYLSAENAYTDAVMKPTVAFQESLYAEMLARIKEDDQSVPYPLRGYFYYSRTEKGKQYPIYCRKAGSLEAPEQVMLDLNQLAEGHPFLALGAATVSDDGRRLAYTADVTGFRDYTLHVKDLETGALLPDRVEKVSAVAWAADGLTIFYVTEDEAKRPYRLHRHRLGAAVADLLYEEPDALFRFHVGRSRSLAYLFLISGSFTSTEVRHLPAADSDGTWRMLLPREKDHEYQVDHGTGPDGDLFYIRTNRGGLRNFRLVAAPVADPHPDRWRELIPHRADVMIEDLDVFARHYVVHEREDGLIRLRVTDARSGAHHHVQFPEPTYDLSSYANAEFETGAYRLRYQSLITPASVFDYDIAGRRLLLLKQTEVLGGYDPSGYRSERLFAAAPDGTRVPVSLVYRLPLERDGGRPLLLQGYG
ncbi:MAG: oligopeptidase B, partial [Candidatus Rokuibacteriota bacterium]